jgi:16S rRNA (uracil1498-N3)-methyltransferase
VSDRIYLPEMAGQGEMDVVDSEAHHLLNVLRVADGDRFEAFDGQGRTASAVVIAKGRKSLRVSLSASREDKQELPLELTVAVALPKGDRVRFLVEKLTELGVECLIPLVTARSNSRSTGSQAEKLDRYVIEACKQSGRNRLMTIGDAQDVSAFAQTASQFGHSIILEPRAAKSLAGSLSGTGRTAAICVGPEGGWTANETESLVSAGWVPYKLGWNILRTETAAIASASIVIELAAGRLT